MQFGYPCPPEKISRNICAAMERMSGDELYAIFFGTSEEQQANEEALRNLVELSENVFKTVVDKALEQSVTPLQEVGHEEWLEKKILDRAYSLCYNVLELVEDMRGSEDIDAEEFDAFGLCESQANEILLIRDLMREE
jgi:hypothetical protein